MPPDVLPTIASTVKKAVIPVAGLGTRMLPATKVLPKEMLPVAGKPLIQYSVEEAAASGIETVVLVSRDDASSIVRHFSRNYALEELLESRGKKKEADLIRHLSELVTFCVVKQRTPLGLGHAVACAQAAIGENPFALLLPDVIIDANEPCTSQLMRVFPECGNVIAIRRLEQDQLQRHGVIAYQEKAALRNCLSITAIVEKPKPEDAPSEYGVFGRYVLQPNVFDLLMHARPQQTSEIQITDALSTLAGHTRVVGLLFEGEHYDAGDTLGFVFANLAMSLRNPQITGEVRSRMRALIK